MDGSFARQPARCDHHHVGYQTIHFTLWHANTVVQSLGKYTTNGLIAWPGSICSGTAPTGKDPLDRRRRQWDDPIGLVRLHLAWLAVGIGHSTGLSAIHSQKGPCCNQSNREGLIHASRGRAAVRMCCEPIYRVRNAEGCFPNLIFGRNLSDGRDRTRHGGQRRSQHKSDDRNKKQ